MLFTFIFLVCCADRQQDGCKCVSQKYERLVIKNSHTQNIISASAWYESGSPENYKINDCSKDGSIAGSGSTGAILLADGNYSVKEYEIRLKCY